MFKYLLFLFFLILLTNTNANNKDKIIQNLKNTKNLNFEFEQNINGKIENGNWTIEYPKKIFCEYFKNNNQGEKDELYQQALEIIRSEGKASTSFLQRKLQIGYNRAARIIDMMEADGIVSKANHVGKRDVL